MPDDRQQPAGPLPQAPAKSHTEAITQALCTIGDGLRALARDVRTGPTRTELVALGTGDRVVCACYAEADDAGGATLLVRALAARAWLEEHADDWLPASPGREPDATPPLRTIIVAPLFAPLTLAAARAAAVETVLWRAAPQSGEVVLFELDGTATPGAQPAPASAPPAPPAPHPPAHQVGRPVFRSGLSDDELDLSPEERSEFG